MAITIIIISLALITTPMPMDLANFANFKDLKSLLSLIHSHLGQIMAVL